MAGQQQIPSRARRWSLSPSAYRRLTLLAALALAVIIVTGALVRLTGSGLGCPDWPQCNEARFVDVSSTHGAIEQVNRLFTGLVAVSVMLAVLGSLVRRPRRRDLTWLSVGLVAGVIGQIVLGGITVLTDLHPAAVQAHFVLSIVILTDALVLHQRASEEPGPYRSAPDRALRREVLAASAVIGLAIVTGTVVTGTGPHGGDEEARRFGFAVTDVARVHSVTALVATGALLWLAWRARRGPAWSIIGDSLGAVLMALVVQGTIGYMQYLNGIPVPLVALHVTGSVVVWWLTCRLTFATRVPVSQASTVPQPDDPGMVADAPNDGDSSGAGEPSAINR